MTCPLKVKTMKDQEILREILKKRWPKAKIGCSDLSNYVKSIIDEVKMRGDEALIDFTVKFDGVKLSPSNLKVDREEIEKAYEKVTEDQISALKFAKGRVEELERTLMSRIEFEYECGGIKVRSCVRPIQSVGCYVPGGEASYPSTLIMTAVPAKIAGVPRIVVSSPPKSGGEINPLTLVAADICGVNEFYRIGGVQAVAALAYGTETIRPVEKIVGPGNKYVMTAKMLVSQDVPIDLIAGPSEILIIADNTADPKVVALDMISQAEHGADSLSILVTTSARLARLVTEEIVKMLQSLPNRESVVQALSKNGLVLICDTLEEAASFVNEFGPEHLELMTEKAWDLAEKIHSADLILIGRYVPVSASDYCLGTNHVLPTGGYSRVFSGLSVLDFVKRVNIIEGSEEGLLKIRRNVRVLAETEGLLNHALAVEERFKS